jgi:virulence-associated protein VapD
MINRRRRYINFDLNSECLRCSLGGESGRTGAYSHIKKFMTINNFEHRQGSSYMSNLPMSDAEIYNLTDNLVRKHAWMANCVTGYDITNVGVTHDYSFVFMQYNLESNTFTLG